MNRAYLINRLPSSEILLELEPQEFGAILLEAVRQGQDRRVHVNQAYEAFFPVGQEHIGYRRAQREAVQGALIEAWSWLEAQGLLVWDDFANGPNGFRRLSRRAQALEPEAFADFAIARAIPRDLLHSRIRERVWGDFVRGHYDSAVLFAAREVEIAVREACGYGNERLGTNLMRDAFNSTNGPLTDQTALAAERDARSALFAGFIGCYKNPLSHQDLDMDDPLEAIEMIMLASHLLRIIDSRVNANDEEAR